MKQKRKYTHKVSGVYKGEKVKVKRKFGVLWRDLVDPNKDPLQAVRVIIYMPREVADIERATIEGIKNLIKDYKDIATHCTM